MGLGSFFRRLRGDERAMPDPDSAEFQQAVQGSALPGSTEMGHPEWASASAAPAPGTPGAEMPGTRAPGPAVTPESLIAAGVPAEHAQRAAAAMARLQRVFGGGSIQVEGASVDRQGSHTLDLRGMEGMRDEMREVMRRHGVDPDSGAELDAGSVPGLQEALLGVLARHGVDVSRYSGG